jgi:hypothetical protein
MSVMLLPEISASFVPSSLAYGIINIIIIITTTKKEKKSTGKKKYGFEII